MGSKKDKPKKQTWSRLDTLIYLAGGHPHQLARRYIHMRLGFSKSSSSCSVTLPFPAWPCPNSPDHHLHTYVDPHTYYTVFYPVCTDAWCPWNFQHHQTSQNDTESVGIPREARGVPVPAAMVEQNWGRLLEGMAAQEGEHLPPNIVTIVPPEDLRGDIEREGEDSAWRGLQINKPLDVRARRASAGDIEGEEERGPTEGQAQGQQGQQPAQEGQQQQTTAAAVGHEQLQPEGARPPGAQGEGEQPAATGGGEGWGEPTEAQAQAAGGAEAQGEQPQG